MMEAHKTQETLSAYIDGELPAQEAERVAEHLKECARCHAQMEELQEICHLLAPIKQDSEQKPEERSQGLPEVAGETAEDPVRSRIKRNVKRKLRQRIIWTLIAAFIIVIPLAAAIGSIPIIAASFDPSLPEWFKIVRAAALLLFAVPLLMWVVELIRDIPGIVVYSWLTDERGKSG